MALRPQRLHCSTGSLASALFFCIFSSACGDTSEAMIGPEGGELRAGDVTVTIPPGAMGTTRSLRISQVEESLSRSSVAQVGDAYVLEPEDLKLKIPATVTIGKLKDVKRPTLLHMPGDASKVHTYSNGEGDEAIGYIGAFGKIAGAEGTAELATISEPVLLATPDLANASAPYTDSVKLAFSPGGLSIVDLVLTAYDLNGDNNRDLNGAAYCAFKPEHIQGASIATGCSTRTTTAVLSLTSANVDLDAVPFLLGKVDNTVIVQVELGSQELVHTLGYFAFNTSPCYYETCSGYGSCVDSSGTATCECVPGYVKSGDDGLACECAPQCDGRECGPDSCGGSCSPGCGDGFACDGEAGVCKPDGSTTTDPSTSTSTGDPTTSTTGDTDTDTGTTGDTDTGTTGDTDTDTGTTGDTGDTSTTGDTDTSTT